MSTDEQDQRQQAIDELAAIGAPQVVAGTISTLVNLVYLRLGLIEGGEQHANITEAAMGIDAIAALAPVIERAAPPEVTSDLRSTLAALQLAFAEVSGGGKTASAAEAERAASTPPAPERPRIWTPGGDV
jgi:hypothetical protein